MSAFAAGAPPPEAATPTGGTTHCRFGSASYGWLAQPGHEHPEAP